MRRLFLALPLLAVGLGMSAPANAESADHRTSCLVPCDPGPDIEVHYTAPLAYITSGTETFDFGTTPVGTAVFYDDFAIGATQALGDLTISSITVPAGFTYVYGPNISPLVEQAGASHGTKIDMTAAAAAATSVRPHPMLPTIAPPAASRMRRPSSAMRNTPSPATMVGY